MGVIVYLIRVFSCRMSAYPLVGAQVSKGACNPDNGLRDGWMYTSAMVTAILQDAADKLSVRDGYLMKNPGLEWALMHRFACYLECDFEGYNIDCEWTRNLDKVKKLGDSNRRPDMIVHKRGKSDFNLLLLEAKRPGSHLDSNRDLAFDSARELGYSFGYVLTWTSRDQAVVELVYER